jgi:MtN3 and saliva related transmembrane protein
MTIADAVGYGAATCTTLAFVPQVWRVWRTRSADDISAAMYVVFFAGLTLWFGYGVLLGSWPIIVANAFTMLLAGSVLWMKLRFSRKSGIE